MSVEVSPAVEKKLLQKHQVTVQEVTQALNNRTRSILEDKRENHKTDPPTWWIISSTNQLRSLKVCFIISDGTVVIKTAYEPNQVETDIYFRHSQEI